MIEPKAPPAPPPAAPAPQAPEPAPEPAPAAPEQPPAEPPVKPEPEEEQGEDPIRWPIELAFRDDATREQIKDMMKHANDKMFDAEFSMMMAGFNAGEPEAKLKSMHDKLDPATQKEFVDTMQRVYGQSHPEWAKELADHHSAMADETEADEPRADEGEDSDATEAIADNTPKTQELQGAREEAADAIAGMGTMDKEETDAADALAALEKQGNAQPEAEKPVQPEAQNEEDGEPLPQKKSPDNQPIELAKFGKKGVGLKATAQIKKGADITFYGGAIVDKKTGKAMKKKGEATHLITNKAGGAIDGRINKEAGRTLEEYVKRGQLAQFANEGDGPANAKFVWYTKPEDPRAPAEMRKFGEEHGPAIAIKAVRDIAPGEEITVNYGRDYPRAWLAGEPEPPEPESEEEDSEFVPNEEEDDERYEFSEGRAGRYEKEEDEEREKKEREARKRDEELAKANTRKDKIKKALMEPKRGAKELKEMREKLGKDKFRKKLEKVLMNRDTYNTGEVDNNGDPIAIGFDELVYGPMHFMEEEQKQQFYRDALKALGKDEEKKKRLEALWKDEKEAAEEEEGETPKAMRGKEPAKEEQLKETQFPDYAKYKDTEAVTPEEDWMLSKMTKKAEEGKAHMILSTKQMTGPIEDVLQDGNLDELQAALATTKRLIKRAEQVKDIREALEDDDDNWRKLEEFDKRFEVGGYSFGNGMEFFDKHNMQVFEKLQRKLEEAIEEERKAEAKAAAKAARAQQPKA